MRSYVRLSAVLFTLVAIGHLIPRAELVRETLGWLDRYLGPVQ
jgi:hypothetical protein